MASGFQLQLKEDESVITRQNGMEASVCGLGCTGADKV